MKSATITAVVMSLASATSATPISKIQAREPAIFGTSGGEDNLVSGIFDSAACLVSGILGGKVGSDCNGQGTARVQYSNGNSFNGNSFNGNLPSQGYTFTYGTNQDGTLAIKITLSSGGSCTSNVAADGNSIQDVVGAAAARCINN